MSAKTSFHSVAADLLNEHASLLLSAVDPTLSFDFSGVRLKTILEAARAAQKPEETLLDVIRRRCEHVLLDEPVTNDEDLCLAAIALLMRVAADSEDAQNALDHCKRHAQDDRTLLEVVLREFREALADPHAVETLVHEIIRRAIEAGEPDSLTAQAMALIHHGVLPHLAISDVCGGALIYRETEDECLNLKNLFAVTNADGRIKQYFAALESILDRLPPLPGRKGRPAIGFSLPIKIASGFVAPLNLVAGLMSRFDEDWPKIIHGFDWDMDGKFAVSPSMEPSDYRQAQLFTYYCWLLWGPSVPLDCTNQAEKFALQYGYGDENNSMHLVFKSQPKALRAFVEAMLQESAIPARKCINLKGRLIQDPWPADPDNPDIVIDYMGDEIDCSEKLVPVSASANSYYSAYVWVAFVACFEDEKGSLCPLHPTDTAEESKAPWRSLLPVFVHGNIADPETYKVSKTQLVFKALGTLKAMLSSRKNFGSFGDNRRPRNIHFVYACAFDDDGSGCGGSGGWQDKDSIRTTLEKLLEESLFEDIAGHVHMTREDAKLVNFNASNLLNSVVTPHLQSLQNLEN